MPLIPPFSESRKALQELRNAREQAKKEEARRRERSKLLEGGTLREEEGIKEVFGVEKFLLAPPSPGQWAIPTTTTRRTCVHI